MASSRKIILFEANEIPFRVIDDYVTRNPRCKLRGLLSYSKQFSTICEDQVELDPWISWSTLHRGVIDERHQIFHLGQSLEQVNRQFPPIWDLLARRGISVGVMGSLHTSAVPDNVTDYAFYVPDFFAHETFAHPPELQAFQRFNLAMTRKSARNVAKQIPIRDALRFLANYVHSGMTPETIRTGLSELATEILRPHLKCRRRSIQPLITLDIFAHLIRKTEPQFATLYTNHVAAAMHRYWAAEFPDDVPDNPMPDDWRTKYRNEITYSMHIFDAMIGRLRKIVDKHPDYLLLVASSMGQAAVRSQVTRGFVTITDLARLMQRLGFTDADWSQRFSMVPCVSVEVDASQSDLFEQRLRQIRVDGKGMIRDRKEIAPLSFDRKGDSFQLYVYFERYEGTWTAHIGDEAIPFGDMGLGFHEHQDDVACSARHTPHGMLLVYDPTMRPASAARMDVSTLDIAPAILDLFEIQPSYYMNKPDPNLLDASVLGTSIKVSAVGGGVERPVSRLVGANSTSQPPATIH